MTAGLFGQSFTDIMAGTIDLTTDTFKMMLLTGFTADIDTMHYRSDRVGTEASGSGYTAGGATITPTSATMSYDAASNEIRWTHGTVSWVTASFTAAQALVFKSRGGTSAADELVYWCDFGGQTVTLGTFTYQPPATGQIAVTAS